MNIESENKIGEDKKKISSYKKIATEADSKETKDNKDNQTVIVVES